MDGHTYHDRLTTSRWNFIIPKTVLESWKPELQGQSIKRWIKIFWSVVFTALVVMQSLCKVWNQHFLSLTTKAQGTLNLMLWDYALPGKQGTPSLGGRSQPGEDALQRRIPLHPAYGEVRERFVCPCWTRRRTGARPSPSSIFSSASSDCRKSPTSRIPPRKRQPFATTRTSSTTWIGSGPRPGLCPLNRSATSSMRGAYQGGEHPLPPNTHNDKYVLQH